MNNASKITEMTTMVEAVFNGTNDYLLNSKEGERKATKKVIAEIAAELGMEISLITPFISFFVHNMPELCYVSPGKYGGVVRGVRPAAKNASSPATKKTINTAPIEEMVSELNEANENDTETVEETDTDIQIANG